MDITWISYVQKHNFEGKKRLRHFFQLHVRDLDALGPAPPAPWRSPGGGRPLRGWGRPWKMGNPWEIRGDFIEFEWKLM